MRLLPLAVLLTGCGGSAIPALDVQSLELWVMGGKNPHFEVKLKRVLNPEEPSGARDRPNCPLPASAVVSANGARLEPVSLPLEPLEGLRRAEPCNTVWVSQDLGPLNASLLVLDLEHEGQHLQAHYPHISDPRTLTVTSPTNGTLHDAEVVTGTYESPTADLVGIQLGFFHAEFGGSQLTVLGQSAVVDGKWTAELPSMMWKGPGKLVVWGYRDVPTARCDFTDCRFFGYVLERSLDLRLPFTIE